MCAMPHCVCIKCIFVGGCNNRAFSSGGFSQKRGHLGEQRFGVKGGKKGGE